jgi:hypothetical protein
MARGKIFLIVFLFAAVFGCGHAKTADPAEDKKTDAGTPVTVTAVAFGPLSETTELNATSAYQLKSTIKASATGYLKGVNAKLGQQISQGYTMFVIKTKEAEALGNTINSLDPSFRFTGLVYIKASENGYVSTLNYKTGDYVTDGEALAVISDINSFAFLMDLPYELKATLASNKELQLKLPDGTILKGYVAAEMPLVDAASQTQQIVIKLRDNKVVPENLIAKVTLIKQFKNNAAYLPKAAVLTDEVQADFWVMKLINDSTAIKVPVKKGIEAGENVEIVSPQFTTTDKILLTGNYGLSDTAKIIVQKASAE